MARMLLSPPAFAGEIGLEEAYIIAIILVILSGISSIVFFMRLLLSENKIKSIILFLISLIIFIIIAGNLING